MMSIKRVCSGILRIFGCYIFRYCTYRFFKIVVNMCFTKGQIEIGEWSYGDSSFYLSRYLYEIKLWSPSIDHTTRECSQIPSSEEASHIECSEELVAHQEVSRWAVDEGAVSENTDNDWMESINITLSELEIAVVLVESRLADLEIQNVTVHCSEEFVHDTNVDDGMATVTASYIHLENEIDSEEETNINCSNDIGFTSQERASLQKNDFTLNDEFRLSRDARSFVSNDDGTAYNESTVGIMQHSRRNFDYSNSSFKSKIVGSSELAGAYCESDRPHKPQDQLIFPQPCTIDSIVKPVTENDPVITNKHQPYKNSVGDHKDGTTSHIVTGYIKPVYHVLVDDTVKIFSTNQFALLPQHTKFLVKERIHDPTVGYARAKLVMKSCWTTAEEKDSSNLMSNHQSMPCDDDDDNDVTSSYFRQNSTSPGRILYTRDRRFNGRTQYPVPNGKTVNARIGKGGNGFVFTLYHDRKQYAVKKTVYRANEINVHSALKHKNILPLLAVLMGEKHERHRGKFYCFHFMPRMDYDLRQILSSKDVGCMKYYYRNSSREPARWETGFSNIKFILAETLEAVAYMHSNGFVHRDVKASNIMIKMRCHCRPLECTCSSKFQVKLGDFDSAGTVPGLGITEPTDQLIKFASILPLGTPGYRAPEVSMHIVLSGPYETLYTTAVDMWSFGCLVLNICIGKTAAVKQREEAQLLLSRTHTCSTELWEKTTKINDLKKTKPFCNELELIRLVGSCLQVDSANRPSAKDAIKVLRSLVKEL